MGCDPIGAIGQGILAVDVDEPGVQPLRLSLALIAWSSSR